MISNGKRFRKNLKRLIPLALVLFFISVITVTPVEKEIKNIAGVYTTPSIYENAMNMAVKNEKVILKLGKLESVGFMAIMEGAINYSNNDNSIDMSFRVKGSKGKGRMHILADRMGKEWAYKKIEI